MKRYFWYEKINRDDRHLNYISGSILKETTTYFQVKLPLIYRSLFFLINILNCNGFSHSVESLPG